MKLIFSIIAPFLFSSVMSITNSSSVNASTSQCPSGDKVLQNLKKIAMYQDKPGLKYP